MMEKARSILIMVAPNGARRTKADHPGLPMTNEEIVRAVAGAHEAGAGAAHVHVRDEEGAHSLDADRYRDLLTRMRREIGTGCVTQITTEAVGCYQPPEQRAVVDAVRPEAVSLAVGELLPHNDTGEREESLRWLQTPLLRSMAIQWICYGRADLDRLLAEEKAGNIEGGVRSVLFVVGRYAANGEGDPRDLAPFLNEPLPGHVMVCGFGRSETATLSAAAAFNLDLRAGFENSLQHADGTRAANNAEKIDRLIAIGHALARPALSGEGVRHRLGAPL